METITQYPCEGGIIELTQVPVEYSAPSIKAPAADTRKKLSKLEQFAMQASGLIDAVVKGKNKAYLNTTDIGLVESYLRTYIEESKDLKEIASEQTPQNDEDSEEEEVFDESREVSRAFIDYLKEQKKDEVMDYLRDNLTYNTATELLSFASNPNKRLYATEKKERVTMLSLLYLKNKLKDITDEK